MIFYKFFIFVYICGSFLPSWIRIRIPNPDPDPQTQLNPDPIRIRNPDSKWVPGEEGVQHGGHRVIGSQLDGEVGGHGGLVHEHTRHRTLCTTHGLTVYGMRGGGGRGTF